MSSVLSMVARVLMLGLVVTIVMALPWPDIEPFLQYLQTLFNMLYLLNTLLDVDTLFVVGKMILVLDIVWLAKIIAVALFHFVSSGSFSGGAAKIDSTGEGV